MLESIRENLQQREELISQLQRQLDFERDFGIVAHEIQSIRVRGRGTSNRQSWVTMRDGTEHHVVGVDVKFALDGVEDWRVQ